MDWDLKMTKSGLTREDFQNVKSALDESAIVAITDAKGTITYVNERFCKVSMYSENELVGQNHRIINSGFHSKDFFKSMWETISSGLVWEGEIQNRAKDGSLYWVHTTIVPYPDEDGNPSKYVAIRYEVTDLKRSEENFKVLLNSTFEGIIVHDRGRVLSANAPAAELFHQKVEELLEKDLFSLFGDRIDTRLASLILESNSQTHELQVEIRGSPRILECGAKTITFGGKPASLLTMRDITARKDLEAQVLQQDRLASLGVLASSLAHEIGTPIGIIRGRAELVQRNSPDPSVKETMTLIVGQIDRVTKLIQSLLHLARQKKSDFATKVSVKEAADDVLNLMSHEISKNNIHLMVGDLNHPVLAEAEGLRQVLLNLLVNAVQAIRTADKRVDSTKHEIEISASRTSGFLQLNIRDTGCGISEANSKNLFKPFFTTKGIGEGTGLGLATTYKILQSWGGQIAVKSKEGQGSTFTITIPQG
jgi:PAS domain S-box-containing protein